MRRGLGTGWRQALAGAIQQRHSLIRVRLSDDQRRRQAEHIHARRNRQQPFGHGGILHFAIVDFGSQLEAEQQARTAHILNNCRMLGGKGQQAAPQMPRHLIHTLQEAGGRDHIHHRIAGSTCQRPAAIG